MFVNKMLSSSATQIAESSSKEVSKEIDSTPVIYSKNDLNNYIAKAKQIDSEIMENTSLPENLKKQLDKARELLKTDNLADYDNFCLKQMFEIDKLTTVDNNREMFVEATARGSSERAEIDYESGHISKKRKKLSSTQKEKDNKAMKLEGAFDKISSSVDQSIVERMLFKNPNIKELFKAHTAFAEDIFQRMVLEKDRGNLSNFQTFFVDATKITESLKKDVKLLTEKSEELDLKVNLKEQKFKEKRGALKNLKILENAYREIYEVFEKGQPLVKELKNKEKIIEKKTDLKKQLQMIVEREERQLQKLRQEHGFDPV